ncbi:MAG: nucleoside 2-deoxyribosyltransferase [SAR324 cluster bacterium]|jgi:nucleoside 2-deoxyribosyltransferase|nr:nucleoside 2-deoxyribosyltransferase [SAR324 cluster bacterium]MCH2265277.1 nucleoside 2-deoxyribosyltransferase [SAR324 cluster bacterium]|tara:strand:- start:71 stop:733 length:663 start_codon:yes stop_codon:yes gene_type:complete
MSNNYSIYFAGDLFNHKDLIGNLLLSEAIEKESSGRYICVVPQHLEQSTNRSIDIRNSDLKEVVKADLILLNFDGTELDSGTVIEFLFAKALDIPAVILRSDFRAAGDQERGDPWNLMCSGYPRTRSVSLNAMSWYQEAWKQGGGTAAILERFYGKLSKLINAEFDLVLKEPSLFDNQEMLSNVYEWALRFPGNGFADLFSEEELRNILVAKQNTGSVLT